MIYTVTLNPSLDYLAFTDGFAAGSMNRASKTSFFAGGKGINVSSYLKNCGVPSIALGFLAGFTGEQIRRMLEFSGIDEDMILLPQGQTRINVKIKSGDETELNGTGPQITEEDIGRLFEQTGRLTDGDILIMSGSIPPSLSTDIYAQIMRRTEGKDIRIAVDAEGQLLLDTLPLRPFLIKPNDDELSRMLDIKTGTYADALKGAEKLQSLGGRNIIVSMGGKGAVLLTEDGEQYICEAAEGTAVNTVGAGDCLLAGFIAEFENSGDPVRSLEAGVAAGCACAFSEGIPLKEDALKLIGSLRAVKV